MDPLGDNIRTIPPSSYRSTTLVALVIIILQVAIAATTYPWLPAIVPSHWNWAGHVDAYMPKLANALFVPLMSISVHLLLRVFTAISPRLGNQNARATQTIINVLAVGILSFLLVVQVTTVAIALGLPINISFVLSLSISALFIFIGNYLGKLRRNFWAGIRTPWTLVSDAVWERTHRLGGWLFVAVGVLGVIISFIPFFNLWGLLVLMVATVVILVVYSYVVYRRVETSGRDPLSPPFGRE